ncbi:MAG: ABC-F family ATP-binding cassette domain-containing protein [Halobacteriovoraceae bacterium]|nr:ABC-F family ATP-binding cassette domain-containing protein [Halobacteriovoraceae bacterium]
MLNISNVTKILGGTTLYENASFQVNPGEKVGLVGPNGAGKSTFFRMIMGEERPNSGSISFPEKMRIAYFSQSVGEMKGKTALQEVTEGDARITELRSELKSYEEKMSDYENISDEEMNELLMKMGEAQTEFEKRGGYDLESRAEEILTGLGIMPKDHQNPTEDFSGGWKMRIALAKVLVLKPDLILMDEPTNYLDMETILWLENWLQNYEGSVLMTTHDRVFMNNVVKKIVEVSNSVVTTYSGNYDFYEKERLLRREQIKSQVARQEAMLKKEEAFIEKFKARASHAAQVQSRVKKLEKIERVKLPQEDEQINFEFSTPSRGSDDVIVAENLSKVWQKSDGSELEVFKGLTVTVNRLEKIAVVGVNGAGKSTLLKIMANQIKPSTGSCKLGASTKMGYFSQFSFDVLKPENTVFEEVRSGLKEASDGYIRNLLAAFLFRGDDVEKKVKHLSGGEKSRLILAVLLSQNNNLLILDEPTNHLDIKSREVLLEALKKYEGTVLIVSHDRHFLEDLANKVYEVDQGEIRIYPGTYREYLAH